MIQTQTDRKEPRIVKKQVSWLFGVAMVVVVLVAAGVLLYHAATGGVQGDGKAGEVKSMAGRQYPGLPTSGR